MFSTLCSDVQGGFIFKNGILRTFERGSAENENVVENSYIIYNIYNIYLYISIKIHVKRKSKYRIYLRVWNLLWLVWRYPQSLKEEDVSNFVGRTKTCETIIVLIGTVMKVTICHSTFDGECGGGFYRFSIKSFIVYR